MATVVKKRPGETEDSLISRFRKKIQAEQLLTKLREKQFYKKPSVLKKERLAVFRRLKKRKKGKWCFLNK